MKEAGHKRTSSEAHLRVCVDPTAAGSTGKAESRTEGAKGGGTGGVEGRR